MNTFKMCCFSSILVPFVFVLSLIGLLTTILHLKKTVKVAIIQTMLNLQVSTLNLYVKTYIILLKLESCVV